MPDPKRYPFHFKGRGRGMGIYSAFLLTPGPSLEREGRMIRSLIFVVLPLVKKLKNSI